MKQKAVIFDLDGTVTDCEHRRHFIKDLGSKDWDAFYAAMVADQPKPNVVAFSRMVSAFMSVIVVTGRPGRYLEETLGWMNEHGFMCEALFMRKDGDFRPDVEIKREIYYDNISPLFDVVLALDDRTSVAKMWRSLGIECWQVAEGDF